MSDTELVEFVEKHGLQVWPMRKIARKEPDGTRLGGEIVYWTAQSLHPFIQVTSSHWRSAVIRLQDAMKKHEFSL